MTSTFVLCKNINLSCKFLMASYCTWLSKNLSTNDLISVNTTKKCTDVITSLCFVKHLTEHFDTCYNCLTNFFLNTKDFKFVVEVKSTTLYSTCSNCTTTCDCEYILYWHKEWLICITLWVRDVLINCVHEFHNLVSPLAVRIFKSFKS